MINAKKAGTQSAPSEIEPHTKVVTKIKAINITKGKNDIQGPP